MKNNSKGDITFKEGNIFVEVVLRTAEHRVIMKNRLPESKAAPSFQTEFKELLGPESKGS